MQLCVLAVALHCCSRHLCDAGWTPEARFALDSYSAYLMLNAHACRDLSACAARSFHTAHLLRIAQAALHQAEFDIPLQRHTSKPPHALDTHGVDAVPVKVLTAAAAALGAVAADFERLDDVWNQPLPTRDSAAQNAPESASDSAENSWWTVGGVLVHVVQLVDKEQLVDTGKSSV
jgi:hypothetical protein